MEFHAWIKKRQKRWPDFCWCFFLPPVGKQNNSCELSGREPLHSARVQTFMQTEAVCSVVPYETGRRAKTRRKWRAARARDSFILCSSGFPVRVYAQTYEPPVFILRASERGRNKGGWHSAAPPSYDAFFFPPRILELAGCGGGCMHAEGRPSQGADRNHHHLLFIGAPLEFFSATPGATHT